MGGNSGTAKYSEQLETNRVLRGETTRKKVLNNYLDTVGDGSGDVNSAADYSGGQNFLITPQETEVYQITQIIISMVDGDTFTPDNWGGIASLSNGVNITVEKPAAPPLQDIVFDTPPTNNFELGTFATDISFQRWGAAPSLVSLYVYFNFIEKFGTALRLRASESESLIFALEDDFSGLTFQYFTAQGYIEVE